MPLVATRDDLGKNTCVMNDETGWGFPLEPPAETVIPLSGFKTIDCPNEEQPITVFGVPVGGSTGGKTFLCWKPSEGVGLEPRTEISTDKSSSVPSS